MELSSRPNQEDINALAILRDFFLNLYPLKPSVPAIFGTFNPITTSLMSCECPTLPSGCQDCFASCQAYFEPLNVQRNGCIFKVPGSCVYYTGPDIPAAGILNGDSFDTVIAKLNAYIASKS
jgi:hypothetical protein